MRDIREIGTRTYHEYSNDFLNLDKIANIYFTSDLDAKNRGRGLLMSITRLKFEWDEKK